MRRTATVIIAHEELESVKLMVQTWKMFAAEEGDICVVINNGGQDAISKWAQENPDILFGEQATTGIGWTLNQVIEQLEWSEDIFVVVPGMMFQSQTIKALKNAVDVSKRVGLLGPVFANDITRQACDVEMRTAQEAMQYVGDNKCYEVMGLYEKGVYIAKEARSEIGEFDERLLDYRSVIEDYMLRAIDLKWKKLVVNASLLFRFENNNEEYLEQVVDESYISMEEKWGMHYFNFFENQALITMIDQEKDDAFSVLEIGCDMGATLYKIGELYKNVHLYGAELNENAAKIAKSFSNTCVANIEEQNLPFEKNSFDYIIFGDVLEHLRNPGAAIKYCRKLLKENGKIIASIPNLMHISVMKQLLSGCFTYTETGLLDKTHIHFFTYYEMVKMFEENGYEMETINMTGGNTGQEDAALIQKLVGLSAQTENFMYEAFQYVVCARKL